MAMLGAGCGGDPGVGRAEHQALLQRLDGMERRLDALEQASAPAPPAAPDAQADLPNAQPFALPRAEPSDVAHETMHVTVTSTGLSIDGKDMTRDEARTRFEAAAARVPPPRLVVVAEPTVPHAAMVDALDLAREAGLKDVAMSARIHGPGEPEPE